VTSDFAAERLNDALENISKTTIELKKSPKPKVPPELFRCTFCNESTYETIEDLIYHQTTAHNKEKEPNFNEEESEKIPIIKYFICPKCKFNFRSAFLLGKHINTEVKSIINRNRL
jgi:hypothetical protein